MRLIDADALMETIRANDYPLKDRINSTDNGMFTIGIQQAVDEQPTVEAAPIRRGKWRWGSCTYNRTPRECRYECSECQHTTIVYGDGLPWEKYCPVCGARLDL